MGGGIFLGVRPGLYETVMIDSGDKHILLQYG